MIRWTTGHGVNLDGQGLGPHIGKFLHICGRCAKLDPSRHHVDDSIQGLIKSPSYHYELINTLKPRRNGQHFADDIFKRIFFNEDVWISIKISLKFVPKGQINNKPALVQIMAWCRLGDKSLSEPKMVSLLMHICVTRPQWVNRYIASSCLTAHGYLCQWSLLKLCPLWHSYSIICVKNMISTLHHRYRTVIKLTHRERVVKSPWQK